MKKNNLCLKCGKVFRPLSKYNRICPKCKKVNKLVDEFPGDYSPAMKEAQKELVTDGEIANENFEEHMKWRL